MLKLHKQNITTLSKSEMNTVQGGGYKRSQRKTGHCAYSYNHTNNTATSCKPRRAAAPGPVSPTPVTPGS